MAQTGGTRIQLCGRLLVQLEGARVEDSLPGTKGRLLLAYLVLNRARRLSRDELLIAVYGDDASPEQSSSLSVLLSKLRAVVGSVVLSGRSEIEVTLDPGTFVDVEAAFEGIHRAESHAARGEWAETWGPAGVAYHVASRPLLQGHDLPWLDDWRRRLGDVRLVREAHHERRALVPRSGAARIGCSDVDPSRSVRAPACRARPVPRDRPPHPDGDPRAAGERRGGLARI